MITSVAACATIVFYLAFESEQSLRELNSNYGFLKNDTFMIKADKIDPLFIYELLEKMDSSYSSYAYYHLDDSDILIETSSDIILSVYTSVDHVSNHLVPDNPNRNDVYEPQMIEGHDFNSKDITGIINPIIIQENLSHYLFGDSNPIGLKIPIRLNSIEIYGTIIGVVSNSYSSLKEYQRFLNHNLNNFYTSIYLSNNMIENESLSTPMTHMIIHSHTGNVMNWIDYFNHRPVSNHQIVSWDDFSLEYRESYHRFSLTVWTLYLPIILLSLSTILILLIYIYRNRSIEYSIRQAIGAKKKDIYLMSFYESVSLGGIAISIGFYMSVVLFSYQSLNDKHLPFYVDFQVKPFSIFFIFVLLIIFYISCVLLGTILSMRKQISEGLKFL